MLSENKKQPKQRTYGFCLNPGLKYERLRNTKNQTNVNTKDIELLYVDQSHEVTQSVESRTQNEDIPGKNLYNKNQKIYYSEE